MTECGKTKIVVTITIFILENRKLLGNKRWEAEQQIRIITLNFPGAEWNFLIEIPAIWNCNFYKIGMGFITDGKKLF